MRVAIIGYGVEGKAAYRYWAAQGAELAICDLDTSLEPVPGVQMRLGPDYLSDLGGFDLIVRSPGTRPDLILAANPGQPDIAHRMTSSTREFLARCPAKIIGVTGTNGKGTTATLIDLILKEAGLKSWLGGNIGLSPLEFLDQVSSGDIVVLELSSFQLIDAMQSPQIAICLQISPEHLNWHPSLDEYYLAKSNLFRYQTPADLAIFKAANPISTQIASVSPGRQLPFGKAPGAYIEDAIIKFDNEVVCPVSKVRLSGTHNLENVCAAITATWDLINHDATVVERALERFTGLPHRLEYLGEVEGVAYYDDSIATTPDPSIAAIRSILKPKVLIVGGSDKKSDYTPLVQAIQTEVKHVVVIGQMGPQIAALLHQIGYEAISEVSGTMVDAVLEAARQAQPGDAVLLSPACASFDQYKDYKDRGDQFKAAVRNLETQHAQG